MSENDCSICGRTWEDHYESHMLKFKNGPFGTFGLKEGDHTPHIPGIHAPRPPDQRLADEPFDVFVRRVCPDFADLILSRVEELETKLSHSQDSHDAMFRRAEAEYKRAEQAEQQLADNPAALGREGMVTVWDHNGSYVGCLGTVTWALLLSGLDILALSRRVEELEAENRDFRDEIVREHNALCAAEREANTLKDERDEAIRLADAMRARIAENDGGADDWGRWNECAAYDDFRASVSVRPKGDKE